MQKANCKRHDVNMYLFILFGKIFNFSLNLYQVTSPQNVKAPCHRKVFPTTKQLQTNTNFGGILFLNINIDKQLKCDMRTRELFSLA